MYLIRILYLEVYLYVILYLWLIYLHILIYVSIRIELNDLLFCLKIDYLIMFIIKRVISHLVYDELFLTSILMDYSYLELFFCLYLYYIILFIVCDEACLLSQILNALYLLFRFINLCDLIKRSPGMIEIIMYMKLVLIKEEVMKFL